MNKLQSKEGRDFDGQNEMDWYCNACSVPNRFLRYTIHVKEKHIHRPLANSHTAFLCRHCVLFLEVLQCRSFKKTLFNSHGTQCNHVDRRFVFGIKPYPILPFHGEAQLAFPFESSHWHCLYTVYGICVPLFGAYFQPNLQNGRLSVEKSV